MEKQKRIGILTSGGDCPGLNAVIYAVTKAAAHKGWKVYGIPNGTDGLLELGDLRLNTMPIIWLLLREINSLAGILFLCKSLESLEIDEHTFDIPGQKGMNVLLFLGGSVLGCRGQKNYPSKEEEKEKILADEKKKILRGYKELALDALIAVGGDGSLEIIDDLASEGGWNLIAIPKTIDNDVPSTEQVVGFNTAVEVVAAHLRDLSNTAAAHDRVMIVQVMGRDAGHLALQAGIAGGADAILIPELTPILNEQVIGRICSNSHFENKRR
jgi:6-phosphofructokinase 1